MCVRLPWLPIQILPLLPNSLPAGEGVNGTGPLVDAGWLDKHLADVVILDVRGDTKSFTREPVFRKDKKTGKQILVDIGGHVPGAILVDYKQVRSKREIDGKLVTRIVPLPGDFEKLMQQSGVNRDSAIVIVSPGEGTSDLTMATRLYWTLKYYGHDNMGILNGGMAQWTVDGRKVETKPGKVTAGNWQAGKERSEILATTKDVSSAVKDGSAQLVDNRSISEYFGTVEKSYVYAEGHIPGARVFPNELMNGAGAPAGFLPKDDLVKLMQAMNINSDADTITYCNSGHLASGGWFIMSELLGNRHVRLYDGSMHEWTLNKQPVNSMKME
jgi:thiosulfate/3-mercaptopyruvate sulfurtransferase